MLESEVKANSVCRQAGTKGPRDTKKVTLLIGKLAQNAHHTQDVLHTVFTKGILRLLQYVGVVPARIPSPLVALVGGRIRQLPKNPQPTWLPVT